MQKKRRISVLRGFLDHAEKEAWAALRVGSWVDFGRRAAEWDVYQHLLTYEGIHVATPFRRLVDFARHERERE